MRPIHLFMALPALSAVSTTASAGETFALASPAFTDGGTLAKAQVNAKPSCGTGGDLSPSLAWTAPPGGTESLAVTLFDPDARAGKGWWHWAMVDLPAGLRSLPTGAGTPGRPPAGAKEATNSFGAPGYGGACPPPGDPPHHYVVTLWAIGETPPPFHAGAEAEAVGAWLATHALGRATITARYGR